MLFSGKPIDEQSRSLFASLGEPSSYDALFELNLTDCTYKVLYHDSSKHGATVPSGEIEPLAVEALTQQIHPDDRSSFREFWNLDTLFDRLEKAGGALCAKFRRLLHDGTWGWTNQTVVSAKRGKQDKTVVFCFISHVEIEEDAQKILAEGAHFQHLRERDHLTSLYNATTFFAKAKALLDSRPETNYEIAYLDIEHFKLYNEWYGHEDGDVMLRNIADWLASIARKHNGAAGYLGGDDFVIVLPQGLITEANIEAQLKRPPFNSEKTIGFQPTIGVCHINQSDNTINVACDHAMIAMSSLKGIYAKRVAWYEKSMAEELENETKTLLEAKEALKNREFILYWQPQCNTRTGRIVGLEALVRWQHPDHTLMMPGTFISVLERNGFIASLDLYVWEEVCRNLRSWIDKGKKPVPVSVNISRADLYAIDVVESLENLVQRYNLDRQLLELEITESAYADDNKMTETVNQLRKLGFTILMDDFGSGYSSLNMLKDITVDVLKIDMRFLNLTNDSRRSEGILEAIVSMARLIDLRIIAEGAETKEQVEFLQNIGCDYAQGYYFYHPMSTDTINDLLAQEDIIDHRGLLSPLMDPIDINTLMKAGETSRVVIENLVGGLAVYAAYSDRFELLQVNNAYYRITGCNPVDLRERQRFIYQQVQAEDLPFVLELFTQAERDPVNGAEGTFRRYRPSGELMWLRMKVFFLKHEQDHALFLASVFDATEEQDCGTNIQSTHTTTIQTQPHSASSEKQSALVKGSRLLEVSRGPADNHWCINLSTESFLSAQDRKTWEKQVDILLNNQSNATPTERIERVAHSAKDAEAIRNFLNYKTMTSRFNEGSSYESLEYLQTGDCGEHDRWMELSYDLTRLEDNGDLFACIFISDIDKRKRYELERENRAEHDALTGLTNRHITSLLLPKKLDETLKSNSLSRRVSRWFPKTA
ncbi:MAG: EAL domain-containing protein [Gordonibacter sp.]|nr:EAL domain-containing protein [Gordonibacter sp.]